MHIKDTPKNEFLQLYYFASVEQTWFMKILSNKTNDLANFLKHKLIK